MIDRLLASFFSLSHLFLHVPTSPSWGLLQNEFIGLKSLSLGELKTIINSNEKSGPCFYTCLAVNVSFFWSKTKNMYIATSTATEVITLLLFSYLCSNLDGQFLWGETFLSVYFGEFFFFFLLFKLFHLGDSRILLACQHFKKSKWKEKTGNSSI